MVNRPTEVIFSDSPVFLSSPQQLDFMWKQLWESFNPGRILPIVKHGSESVMFWETVS